MAKVIEGLKFISQDPTVHATLKIIGAMTLGLAGLGLACPGLQDGHRNWLPEASTAPQKRKWELFSLRYGCFWILAFGIIIGGELFVWFDDVHYMVVCVGLASPLLLQPFVFPSITDDADVVWYERYSVKANTWIAIFSFIGNYWYTHYFYTVLQAYYTMPSWDLNGVPIPLYFATHFYFCFYHVLANMALRKTFSTLAPGIMRNVFVVALVIEISYITAFMESLTISGFPCYGFSDRFLAYTLGSAFYGLYFVVSFPMFLRVDENGAKMSLFTVVVEALASGMAVLILLDAVRVALGQDLVFKLDRPCKSDAALTCEPFTYKTC